MTKYVYYCDDCKCFVEENHRCQQWGTVSQMPKEAMKLWVKKSTPKHETVSQWEERTGEVYPDDGPVCVKHRKIGSKDNGLDWKLQEYSQAKYWDDVKIPTSKCNEYAIVANHHGKPEVTDD